MSIFGRLFGKRAKNTESPKAIESLADRLDRLEREGRLRRLFRAKNVRCGDGSCAPESLVVLDSCTGQPYNVLRGDEYFRGAYVEKTLGCRELSFEELRRLAVEAGGSAAARFGSMDADNWRDLLPPASSK